MQFLWYFESVSVTVMIHVDEINVHTMTLFPGITCKSADTMAEEELSQTYPTEFLNSLSLSGLSPHEMELKIGSPVILLHNLRAGPGMVYIMILRCGSIGESYH